MVINCKTFQVLLATVLFVAAVTAAAAQTGKPDHVYQESHELRDRTSTASKALDKYGKQLEKTEHALKQMGSANGDELTGRYKSLSQEIDRLAKVQTDAIHDIDKMRSAGVEYFASFEKSDDRIVDASLRYAGAAERWQFERQYHELAELLGVIGLELEPFMRKLRDLKAFLGADLTRTGLDRADTMIRVSQEDAQVLETRVDDAREKMKSIQNTMPR